MTRLKKEGLPQEDAKVELRPAAKRVAAIRGKGFTLAYIVENRSEVAVENLAVSCHARLDFKVADAAPAPKRLAPGERVEITYRLIAPENLNLALESNRTAFIHLSARFEQADKAKVGHAWSEVVVEK